MFHLRYVLAASVVASVACGAAVAKTASQADRVTPAPSYQADRAAPAQAAASAGVDVSVTVRPDGVRHLLISNAPVPDTRENRAKYGQPLSNAGRRTLPAGN